MKVRTRIVGLHTIIINENAINYQNFPNENSSIDVMVALTNSTDLKNCHPFHSLLVEKGNYYFLYL